MNEDSSHFTNQLSFTGQSGTRWRYWIDQPLGSAGGFGNVYAAEGLDDAPMAVKVVNKQRPSGTLDNRLLHREIEIGRRVSESGSDMLLPVIDAGETGSALLLVMARAGEPLSAATPISESDITAVMTDIATGLQQLHSIGIIHRDLKPPNVLFHDLHWKLADFGIARDQEIGTQDPTFLGWGSIPYMAPELWEMKSPTVKTDLYALGCLAFELLTGAPPYTGDQAALRKAHLTQTPPEVPCNNVTLKNLISRLIAKDAGDRPQDSRAVLDRLRRAILSRNPVQESIALGLGVHDSEKSRLAAEAAAAKAAADARLQQIAQAKADLHEVFSDALEDLQAVEPEASLRGQSPDPEDYAFDRITLSTDDVSLQIEIWVPRLTDKVATDDTLILGGTAYISNRRSHLAFTAANLAYEQLGDRLAWQVYKFHANEAEKLNSNRPHGGYARRLGRTHGLLRTFFLEARLRPAASRGMDVSDMVVTPLTAHTALQLFQEAVDFQPSGPLSH
jgi:serine/threonine protein kinase